jgi:hypothetical protein
MTPDERLLAVLAEADDLCELYLTIAQLSRLFHYRCETGTLPSTKAAGHAFSGEIWVQLLN